MNRTKWIGMLSAAFLTLPTVAAIADDDVTSLADAFTQGKVGGSLKSYYFAETYDGPELNNAEIWANGGHLSYETAKFYGARLGAEFQASFVGFKDDEDNRKAGSMDAEGAVLSEAYLQYTLFKTEFKGGRQHVNLPLIANSGSRLIKESFEGYFLTSTDLPDTTISLGWVDKYQTRTDRSKYGDNYFVDFEENGSGRPGDFYDIGENGVISFYVKNTTVPNLGVQVHYANVLDELAGVYGDAKYTFAMLPASPYLAGQYYYTWYEDEEKEDNYLVGIRAGATIVGIDLFAGYSKAGGSEGEDRVFRGIGQGAYYQYTDTTKTAGAAAFEAGTDSYQVGVGYNYEKSFSSKLRFTRFDNPIENADLDEYTLNLGYNFGGAFKNLSVSVDFSVLDYENDDKDATDLRTRLIYSF